MTPGSAAPAAVRADERRWYRGRDNSNRGRCNRVVRRISNRSSLKNCDMNCTSRWGMFPRDTFCTRPLPGSCNQARARRIQPGSGPFYASFRLPRMTRGAIPFQKSHLRVVRYDYRMPGNPESRRIRVLTNVRTGAEIPAGFEAVQATESLRLSLYPS